MFGETLLESSSTARKRKRWPMAAAFIVQAILAAIAVIVPLLSTGVIPLLARVQPPVTLTPVPVERVRPTSANHSPKSGTATSAPRAMEVVLISNNPDRITIGRAIPTTTELTQARIGSDIGSNDRIPELGNGAGDGSNVKLDHHKPLRLSELSQARLLNRVDPVYPKIALLSGVQGEVKLHAIIARDGKIMSLSVISGHPLLVRAAEDAVSQWRYRPYYLNGEPVEVETLITVHFTKGQR
ncbi:MAG TPA: energy transducer TonB [Candidatus Angelobacter sp.]|nr:energy transducer TonB [Candidatus Angelobacter sp.]